MVLAEKGLTLRKEASQSSPALALIPFGSEVVKKGSTKVPATIDGYQGDWVPVTWKGQEGWLWDGYLKVNDPGNYTVSPPVALHFLKNLESLVSSKNRVKMYGGEQMTGCTFSEYGAVMQFNKDHTFEIMYDGLSPDDISSCPACDTKLNNEELQGRSTTSYAWEKATSGTWKIKDTQLILSANKSREKQSLFMVKHSCPTGGTNITVSNISETLDYQVIAGYVDTKDKKGNPVHKAVMGLHGDEHNWVFEALKQE